MKIFLPKNVLALLLVASLGVLVFYGCKKESTDCTAIILAKQLNDTMVVVSYADIIIAPQYQDVRVEGKTDIAGRFEHAFKYEGILDVIVFKPIEGTPDSLIGRGVIRLKPGETTTKTIFLK
ncbi:MAG TPA: hypothetical protein PLI16_09795 [Bacteroidales bacterium]|nr:hypothetical protein [Bacteroidales bacterium]OPZ97962.1 MAG: hypothetical protein BWY70_01348 [Bacteroidetes bacterium ADurb.Bin408]HNZ44128.1 hypothetical protein [Bacteroidales bacterium]HOH84890.1 hypothetical protein [Bacteroidales bacterium]HPB26492.1 hypothetical protein [Bacteroidales bacterium]